MKLSECLNFGYYLGLHTLEECRRNVALHCGMLFPYDKMNQELAELDAEIEQEMSTFRADECRSCNRKGPCGDCSVLANYLHDKYKDEEYLKDPEEWENY